MKHRLFILLLFGLLPSLADALDFPEFYSEVKKEHLTQYLNKTVTLAEEISLDPHNKKNLNILELRNRLGNIYSFWNLTYRKEIEDKLLLNLENILLKNTNSYNRMEAAMALGTTHNKRSIPTLTKALNDENDLVRKYAKQSIERIKLNKFTSYEQHNLKKEELLKYIKKSLKDKPYNKSLNRIGAKNAPPG